MPEIECGVCCLQRKLSPTELQPLSDVFSVGDGDPTFEETWEVEILVSHPGVRKVFVDNSDLLGIGKHGWE